MKIAIIGAGNIGGATALGLLRSGVVSPDCLAVTTRREKSLERFAGTGAVMTTDNCLAAKDADIIIFAVEPWQMEDVVKETCAVIDPLRQVVVSMSPAIKPEQMEEWTCGACGKVPQIAYVIPNIAIEICESMTFISSVTADTAVTDALKCLFDKTGRAEIVPLEKMLAGTASASCGIAYALRYISAAIAGSEALGLSAESAAAAVCQTVRGAAAVVEAHGSAPELEISRVTTPGGLTQRGLAEMERNGFSDAVKSGLMAGTLPKE